jgi:hypothetical protein
MDKNRRRMAGVPIKKGQGGKPMQGCVFAAVLFDIGGVLYIPDVSLNEKWERRLGLPEGQLGEVLFVNPVAERAMVGEATEEEMWDHFGRRLLLPPAELAAIKYDLWEGGAWDTALLDFAFAQAAVQNGHDQRCRAGHARERQAVCQRRRL